MQADDNRRILLVDDNAEIHRDFASILAPEIRDERALDAAEAELFGDAPASNAPTSTRARASFELVSALQGREALDLATRALLANRPFAMAFVDMRMPPGWDGVETIEALWNVDPDLQVVICTAFADYTWKEMVARLGATDRLLILKKPFDAIEVCQLATALTAKWNITLRERRRLHEVQIAESEARAYASSLETVNHALEATRATTEAELRAKQQFLLRMSTRLVSDATAMERAMSSVLLGDADAPGWVDAVEAVCANARGLVSSIDAVREMAAIEAGTIRSRITSVSATDLITRLLEALCPLTERIGLALDLQRVDPLPDLVQTDVSWVERILGSMVCASIATGARTSVRIAVGRVRDAEESWVRFRVQLGPNTPDRPIAELLEPDFARADSNAASIDTSLLGLALCRRLALELGGHLGLADAEHGAPCLSLTVPVVSTTRVAS